MAYDIEKMLRAKAFQQFIDAFHLKEICDLFQGAGFYIDDDGDLAQEDSQEE